MIDNPTGWQYPWFNMATLWQPQQLPTDYLTSPNERIYWLYLLVAGLLAVVVSVWQQRKLPTWQQVKAYLTDKDTRLDIKYFLVIWLIKVLLLAPMLLSAQTVAMAVINLYNRYLPPAQVNMSYEQLMLAYSLSLFLASDFSRYWLHRWLHTNRFLFAFHKVHHAAETLNPLTFYRIHPVESILFGWRYALAAGVVTGGFMAVFGGGFGVYSIFGANALVVVFNLVGSNLRHSSIRLSYGRWLEHVFISPKQHQIHHATRYMRYNYGGSLAIWDWLFGSLKTSPQVHHIQPLGLGKRLYPRYATVMKNLVTPFKDVWRLSRLYVPHHKNALSNQVIDTHVVVKKLTQTKHHQYLNQTLPVKESHYSSTNTKT